MPLPFTKMHGLGNDFIIIDAQRQSVERPERLAARLCDRRRGVGADGLILIEPAEAPDLHFRMRIYNADGSRAEMCGNGIRCAARLAYERGWASALEFSIQTDAGVRIAGLVLDDVGSVRAVCVDMGVPVLAPDLIPVNVSGERAIEIEIPLPEVVLQGTCVSMGNPHAAIFCEHLERVPLEVWGPLIEKHPLFPRGINAQFVQVLTPARIKMRTWERGVGVTQACGTGASAACVAGALTQRASRAVTAELPGGELEIRWDESSGHVLMTGPAQVAYQGVVADL